MVLSKIWSARLLVKSILERKLNIHFGQFFDSWMLNMSWLLVYLEWFVWVEDLLLVFDNERWSKKQMRKKLPPPSGNVKFFPFQKHPFISSARLWRSLVFTVGHFLSIWNNWFEKANSIETIEFVELDKGIEVESLLICQNLDFCFIRLTSARKKCRPLTTKHWTARLHLKVEWFFGKTSWLRSTRSTIRFGFHKSPTLFKRAYYFKTSVFFQTFANKMIKLMWRNER